MVLSLMHVIHLYTTHTPIYIYVNDVSIYAHSFERKTKLFLKCTPFVRNYRRNRTKSLYYWRKYIFTSLVVRSNINYYYYIIIII